MNNLNNNEKSVRLLKNDNGEYFEMVYKHYFAPLYSFATRYLVREEAEGVVQETMLWLWENKGSLIPELSLKSLLFTIVKNRCLNRIGRQEMKSRIHESIVQAHEEQFENPDFYFENELFQIFKESLERLPDAFRQAFEMSRMEGFTHKEIAEKLDVSPQTVNYRLGKALEILRADLKDYLPVFLILLL